MSATNPEVALAVLQERNVGVIAMCPDRDWEPLVLRNEVGTLYRRLVLDDAPPWLRRVDLPASLSGAYAVLEVAPTGE
jgi:hypothetical protein